MVEHSASSFEILMQLIFKEPPEVGNIRSFQWIRKLRFTRLRTHPRLYSDWQMLDLIWGWFITHTAVTILFVKSLKVFFFCYCEGISMILNSVCVCLLTTFSHVYVNILSNLGDFISASISFSEKNKIRW